MAMGLPAVIPDNQKRPGPLLGRTGAFRLVGYLVLIAEPYLRRTALATWA